MNKIYKILCLSLILLIVTGCSDWEDAQEEYGDLLKKGVICSYTYSDQDALYYTGVDKMIFSVDYNGMYVQLDKDAKQTIWDVDGHNADVKTKYRTLRLTKDFIKDFVSTYLEKENTCPEILYIFQDPMQPYFNLYDCEGTGTGCVSYRLGTSTITADDKNLRDCHYSTAVNCSKIVKNKDQFGTKIYLEFGYYKRNKETKKYFGVASNPNFSDIVIDDNSSDGLSNYFNLEWFHIPTLEAENEIYLSGQKIASEKDIVIKANVSTSTIYYITGKNSAGDFGIYDNTGEIEKAPDRDVFPYKYEPNRDRYIGAPNCDYLFKKNGGYNETWHLLRSTIKFMQYLAIALAIVLSIIDFAKVVPTQDKEGLNKAVKKSVTRVIIAVMIFFFPIVLNFVLELMSDLFNVTDPFCGILS